LKPAKSVSNGNYETRVPESSSGQPKEVNKMFNNMVNAIKAAYDNLNDQIDEAQKSKAVLFISRYCS